MNRGTINAWVIASFVAMSACSGTKTPTTTASSSAGAGGCGALRASCTASSQCCSGFCDSALDLCSVNPATNSTTSAASSGATTGRTATSGSAGSSAVSTNGTSTSGASTSTPTTSTSGTSSSGATTGRSTTSSGASSGTTAGPICATCTANSDCATNFCNADTGLCDTLDSCSVNGGMNMDCSPFTCDPSSGNCICPPGTSTSTSTSSSVSSTASTGTSTGSTTAGSTGSTGTTACSNPCAPGSATCGSNGDVQSCVDQGGCYTLVDQGPCSNGDTCANGVCVAATCAGGCVTPPGAICIDANSRAIYGTDGGAGLCNNGTCSYAETIEGCPYGCIAGVCSAQPACSSGTLRCNGNQIETCNAAGTAWLFAQTCPSTCTSGLCDAPCPPNSSRCDGSTVDTCSSDGTQWIPASSACAQGCIAGACTQSTLVVDGTSPLMQGEFHFSTSVDIKNGANLQVGSPDGGTSTGELTIYAPTINIEASSSITGAGNTASPCSADPDNVAHGIRLYATTVNINGYVGWTGSSCAVDGIVIRADTINGSGTVWSSERSLLLFGTGGLATGLDAGAATTSLMPPTDISSPTHPINGIYNDDAPPPVFSWDRPYSTVTGYYYAYGASPNVVPTQTSTFLSTEALALTHPAPIGTTYLDVITIDNTGTPGTVPHQFAIQTVGEPPELSSPSNPNQGTYTTNTAVTIQYDGGNAGVGYYWVFDDYPTTRPTLDTGTYVASTTTPQQVYLQNVADGRHWFHMIAYDTMGYPTLGAEHYEIDIGAAPSNGTIAGNVTNPDGGAIAGATVVVQRGLYTTTTDANGIYDFNASVPAGTYEVVAPAPGYQSYQLTVNVNPGATTDEYFQLTPGSGCPTCTDLCSGVACPGAAPECVSNVAYAPPEWSATCFAGTCEAEFAASNSAVNSCPYGCYGAACADGSLGSPCDANSECSSTYCETNGTCGSSYCIAPGNYNYVCEYTCCFGGTCTNEGGYYYCE